VVRIDAENHRVVVGPREALAIRTIALRDVNWIGEGPFESALETEREIAVRVRSTRPPQPAILRRQGDHISVELFDGEYGVSPGQACVFYDSVEPRARVLGGGIIHRAAALAVAA